MRLQIIFLFLLAAVLLLAKTDSSATGGRIELRAANSRVEIIGSDIGSVEVNESSRATVTSEDGRTVVEASEDGEPIRLQVPRGSSLDVSNSNGAIYVAGVTGALRLITSNGAINVQDAGPAAIHAHSSNGSIRISVSSAVNADVSAHTSNGRIHSDFDIATHHAGASFLEGKIGSGGTVIELSTSNGVIYLNKAGNQESVTSSFKPGEVK